jgi:hypothetical protein
MPRRVVVLGVALATVLPLLADRKKTPEERKAEELAELSRRLERYSAARELTMERKFLHARAADLLERVRGAPAGSFPLRRLFEAVDSVLDASEEIETSTGNRGCRDDDDCGNRQDTARDLERTYFRVMQGDYYAKQSKETNADEYVRTARRLYQFARQAYDAADYRRAQRLADAAREVTEALENLAQAAVPVPDPPVLKE